MGECADEVPSLLQAPLGREVMLRRRFLRDDDLNWLFKSWRMDLEHAAEVLEADTREVREWELRGWLRFFREEDPVRTFYCVDDVQDLLRLCRGHGRPSTQLIGQRLAVLAAARRGAALLVPSPEGATRRACPARVADVLAGGRNGLAADRDFARRLLTLAPWVRLLVRQQREFVITVTRHLAVCGIDQFLQIGTGYPAPDPIHEVAQAFNADARAVYVEADPVAAVHARAFLTYPGGKETAVVPGSLDRPQEIVEAVKACRILDLDRPVGIVLADVLHRLTDDRRALQGLAWLREAVAPGSYLALTHPHMAPTMVPLPPGIAQEQDALHRAADLYTQHCAEVRLRTRTQIGRFFTGWDLQPPGLVPVGAWRPHSAGFEPGRLKGSPRAALLAGLGVKDTKPSRWPTHLTAKKGTDPA